MSNITRRHLLVASTALVPLAACQPGTTVQTVTDAIVADIGLVAGGLTGILPNLSGLGTLAATIVQDVKDAASQIKAGLAANVAAPLVQRIQNDILVIANAIGSVNVPALVSQVIAAAQVLVKAVMPLIGLLVPVAATQNGMTPDVARAVLRTASAS